MRAAMLVVAGLAACTPPHAPTPPMTNGPVIALISAQVEWKIVARLLPEAPRSDTPFGPWLVHRIAGHDVVFFHGGYGKVSAAASTQYAIDRWHPSLIVNLGTCGGFGGERKVGDVVLASETIVYDIVERMGDRAQAVRDFDTQLDTQRWPARLADRVVRAPLVSADGDLDPAAVAQLHATYHASAGDWESGAIAFTAARNHTPVLILRGVSDLVDASGDPTYAGSDASTAWEQASQGIMASLLALFSDALPDLSR